MVYFVYHVLYLLTSFFLRRLIKKHVEQGYKPVIVCSAMGKTTNTLLSAGDFALTGQVFIDSIRTLHQNTVSSLELPQSTMDTLNVLLNELERLLEGVINGCLNVSLINRNSYILGIKYIGELTPRTRDTLVSYGERMSVRIISAYLNKIGVPAQSFDSWTIGMKTTSDFGNAEVITPFAINTLILILFVHY